VRVVSEILRFSTQGHTDVLDITAHVEEVVARSGVREGVAHLFVPGSTAGLTTMEYEPGTVADLQRLMDEIAPPDRDYAHNLRWGDGNGHSHLRASLLGPSLSVPIIAGRLALGTWQQIVLVDFDIRPRQRRVIVHVCGTGTA